MGDQRAGQAAPAVSGWNDLAIAWDKRARFAAAWLRGKRSVMDIGCGVMTLRGLLPPGTRYVPVDLVARDAETIVVDLQHEPIPAIACDAAVMLGVLEYLPDIATVLPQMRRFQTALISYNHRSFHDILWALRIRRKQVDWKHRYTRTQFRRFLRGAGLDVVRRRRIRTGEILYEVTPSA